MDNIPSLDARRQELLEARFLGSSRTHAISSESNMSNASSGNSDKDGESSVGGYTSTPEGADRRKAKKRKTDKDDAHRRGGTNKKIDDYFGSVPVTSPKSVNQRVNSFSSPPYNNPVRSPSSSRQAIDYSGLVHFQRRMEPQKVDMSLQTDLTMEGISKLQQSNVTHETKKNREVDSLLMKNNDLEYQLKTARALVVKYSEQLDKCMKVTKELLIEKTKAEKMEDRKRAMEGRLRLGQFARTSNSYQETWSNGWAFHELEIKRKKINSEKDSIERDRKNLNKRKPNANSLKKSAAASSVNDSDTSFTKPKDKDSLPPQAYHEQDEILRQRLVAIKREEADLQFELERLERQRSLHIREMKRIANEDNSVFNNHKILHERYLLLTLLGKGGFSEVFKGFDLQDQRFVAIKIHHLNRDWREQKKLDYARHANREAEIHRRVIHPRIVKLYDRFEVDINTFCTVMEYCEGNDLDFYLKQHKHLSEKEARTIIMQVVSALKYLNTLERPVIHYDLKPGNILMCDGSVCGNIRITDFGLSKQFDEGLNGIEGMELTSQGAGTYWYLPPECFVRGPGGSPPKIDNKVDVWSVGVIFYQCLYGKKPFGHNLTQEAILKQNTILQATEVTFPSKPVISADAKSFIKQCLMYHKDDRATVFQLANHQYLAPPPNKRLASISNGSM